MAKRIDVKDLEDTLAEKSPTEQATLEVQGLLDAYFGGDESRAVEFLKIEKNRV